MTIQLSIIVAAVVFVLFAINRISEPGYHDDDSSIVFNVLLSLSFVSAIVGGVLFISTVYVGFEKNTVSLLYNTEGNWKAPIIGWGSIVIFFVYMRYLILRQIRLIKIAARREGMLEAMKIYMQNEGSDTD